MCVFFLFCSSVSPPHNLNVHPTAADRGNARIPRSASASVLGRYGGDTSPSTNAPPANVGPVPYSAQYQRSRKLFDKGPSVVSFFPDSFLRIRNI